MIIQHAKVNWENYIPQDVKTLILGSFNPNNPSLNTDYYYGRSTNYLWRAIADLLKLKENYFSNNLERKKEVMEKYSFCFLDLIEKIEISGNETLLPQFVNQKILKEFSGQVLFTTNTTFEKHRFTVQRSYNHQIVDFINKNRVKTLLHTLGNNTINERFITNWSERRLGLNGFQGFVNSIKSTDSVFIQKSYSPSGRAVKVGGQKHYENLKNWLNLSLNLK